MYFVNLFLLVDVVKFSIDWVMSRFGDITLDPKISVENEFGG